MVRTDTKEKAKGLEELYKAKTSLRLKRIDSSMSFGTVHRTIKSLRGKELDGIICVDMLGEGFDFPNLKIAAIHEPQNHLQAPFSSLDALLGQMLKISERLNL